MNININPNSITPQIRKKVLFSLSGNIFALKSADTPPKKSRYGTKGNIESPAPISAKKILSGAPKANCVPKSVKAGEATAQIAAKLPATTNVKSVPSISF